MQILVRDSNIERALKALKRKLQREGIFLDMKRPAEYEKPSEKRARERAEAIRRVRKLARKQAQREGLLPAPQAQSADDASACGLECSLKVVSSIQPAFGRRVHPASFMSGDLPSHGGHR